MHNPQRNEKEILEFWEKNNTFQKRREKNKGNDKWSFIDGPITANYNMGIHHAAGRSYKDLYIRWKSMQGYDQRYQNGFDTQGLPVEVQAEKELEIESKKELEELGIDKFIEKCKEIVKKYSKSQTHDSIRLGQWMDWENSYYTYKDDYIEHVWNFTKKCHEKGLLEEGTRVLPWCPRCGTSLSQKEVTDGFTTLTHTSVFIKLPLKNEDAHLMVWTTTPWTLSANVACAVNPEELYSKVEKDGKTYYLASDSIKTVLKGEHELKEEILGEELIGKEYTPPHPELPAQKNIKHVIIPWKEVGTKEGTGIVHIAPGCGVEDEELGKEHNLESLSPLMEDGTYKEDYGWLTGKNVKGIAEEVIRDLEERGILHRKEDYEHQYPLCWRCDSELVWRKAKGEWFIDQTKIKEQLRREAGKIEWRPDFLEKEYYDWLNNMEKWSISRKRYWGTPLPIWKCSCGNIEVIGTKKELEEKAVEGMDQLKELHRPWIDKVKVRCSECKQKIARVEPVADCWMDSGLVPYATLNYLTDKEHFWKWFPANFVTEMREQVIRWFHTTMVTSVILEDQAPYLRVMTYSEVVDDEGKTMSKSRGNALWAHEAAEKIGMDNVRWTFIQGNPKTKTSLGYESGEEAERELDTLFNIDNYIDQNMGQRKSRKNHGDLKMEDKWLLSKVNTLKKEVTEDLEGLEPHKAARKIKDFFLNDFSRGYIQLTRDRVKEDSEESEKAAGVMHEVLLETLKLMAPFTPFLTEEIYQRSYREHGEEESIHLLDWPEPEEERMNKELEKDMKVAESVNEAILALRSKIGRGLRWPVKEAIILTKDEDVKKSIEKLSRVIKEQTNVKEVQLKEEMPEVSKEIKVNHKAVGAEFQADALKVMEKAKGNLEKVNQEIEEHGFSRIDIGTKEVKLKRKHIIVNRELPQNLVVKEFKHGEAYLDKEMNEELENEGIAREVMRQIQQLRKEAGLVKEQGISLKIQTDEESKEKLREWKEEIKNRTGSREVQIDSSKLEESYDHKTEFEVENRKFSAQFNVLD